MIIDKYASNRATGDVPITQLAMTVPLPFLLCQDGFNIDSQGAVQEYENDRTFPFELLAKKGGAVCWLPLSVTVDKSISDYSSLSVASA